MNDGGGRQDGFPLCVPSHGFPSSRSFHAKVKRKARGGNNKMGESTPDQDVSIWPTVVTRSLSTPSKRREDWERSIFVRLKDGGYGLRDNTLFHLYVSTSPCGDARLHSPYEITKDRKPRRFYLFHQPMLSRVGASVPGCLCPDPACAVWPSPETLDTGGVCHPVWSV